MISAAHWNEQSAPPPSRRREPLEEAETVEV